MKNSDKTILTLVAGAIAGSALAYLSQTEKGKQITNDIKETAKSKIDESLEAVLQKKEEVEANFKKAMADLDLEILSKKNKS